MSQKRGRSKVLTDFTPTKYQDEFLRGDKRYLGFVSGVGAGKTYAGIIRTFLNMEKWNRGEMGAIVAPTRQMIVNVIIPEMRDLGLLEKWEYNSSYSDEPGIHSPNGSRALILSADNKKTIERLRGLNLAWGWVDERTAVPERAQEILSQRLRTGEYRNLFETTTPKGKDDVYDFYVGNVDATEQSFGAATLYETDDRLAIVGMPTDANPNTPDDYKEAMQSDMPDEIRQQEVEGKFVEIGSGVFTREMLTFVQSEQLRDHYVVDHIIAVDPATMADSTQARQSDSDYWGVTVGAAHPSQNDLYLLDAQRERGLTLREGIQWIQQIANQVPDPTVVVEANQSQRWLQQELQETGLRAVPVQHTRNKEDRLIDLSIPLERGTVKFVRQHENDNRWQDMISELLAFPDGTHDDLIDSMATVVENANISTTLGLSTDMYGRD